MLNLTDGNRAYLNEMRALSSDLSGNEVFVGLTREESERYVVLSNPLRSGSFEENEEYIALDDRHNLARMQVLGAEHVKRTESPTEH